MYPTSTEPILLDTTNFWATTTPVVSTNPISVVSSSNNPENHLLVDYTSHGKTNRLIASTYSSNWTQEQVKATPQTFTLPATSTSTPSTAARQQQGLQSTSNSVSKTSSRPLSEITKCTSLKKGSSSSLSKSTSLKSSKGSSTRKTNSVSRTKTPTTTMVVKSKSSPSKPSKGTSSTMAVKSVSAISRASSSQGTTLTKARLAKKNETPQEKVERRRARRQTAAASAAIAGVVVGGLVAGPVGVVLGGMGAAAATQVAVRRGEKRKDDRVARQALRFNAGKHHEFV